MYSIVFSKEVIFDKSLCLSAASDSRADAWTVALFGDLVVLVDGRAIDGIVSPKVKWGVGNCGSSSIARYSVYSLIKKKSKKKKGLLQSRGALQQK